LEYELFLEEGDPEEEEDEVEVGGVTQNFNCPLTLTSLENPLSSCVF
jgi:E3 SUMO-protein ligase NSE2